MKASIFGRVHGEIRPIGPGRLERELTWRQPESPAEELWYRGLIFRAFADFGDGPLEYIYIPEDLHVPADLRQPPADAAPPIIAPVETPRRRDPCAQRPDRGRLRRAGCAPRDPAARWTNRDRLRIQPRPSGCARLCLHAGRRRIRLELLLALARGRGWIKPDRGRLVLDMGAATAWLRRTHWEQMTSLFTAWRDGKHVERSAPRARR